MFCKKMCLRIKNRFAVRYKQTNGNLRNTLKSPQTLFNTGLKGLLWALKIDWKSI